MTVYYMSESLPEALQSLLIEEDEVNPQDAVPEDKKDWITIFENLVRTGRLLIFYENNVAILLRRQTAWVGIFDTKVGHAASTKDIIKTYKAFAKWAKENSGYIKLETRTPFEKYGRVMAKAVGAKLEGTRFCSYKTKENKMINEYEYGFILKDDLCL